MNAGPIHELQPDGALRMLDDVIAERRVKQRDCRDCKNFERDASGLNFGWCAAHKQPVKLYHPAGEWYSQCTFKALRRFKDQELESGGVPVVTADGRILRARSADDSSADGESQVAA